jgi:hypothetical protein
MDGQPRNPFAVRNGKIILIKDLSDDERGLNCRCRCPACDGEFIARMGEVKARHFAHSKDACDEVLAYTSGLYKLIHQILNSGTPFYVPALVVSYYLPNDRLIDEEYIKLNTRIIREDYNAARKEIISPGRYIIFEKAELYIDNKNHIQALELTYKESKMAVKVMPPDTVCKKGTASPHKDMATLAVDFTDDADIIQTSNSSVFQDYLLSERLDKHWIINPKVKQIYPHIISLNQEAYRKYTERQKQIEEEQRLAELQRKKEEKLAAERFAEEQRIAEQELEERQRLAALQFAENQKLSAQRREEIQRNAARQDKWAEIKQNKINNERASKLAALLEKHTDILALGYEQIKDKFVQQTEQIRDSYGYRWVKCKYCGEIKRESEFTSYGGINHVNLGDCALCSREREQKRRSQI